MTNLDSAAGASGSGMGDGGDPQHLTFRKHTPALEWDRPIQIVSYEWTAWKDNPNPNYLAADPSSSPWVDLGKV